MKYRIIKHNTSYRVQKKLLFWWFYERNEWQGYANDGEIIEFRSEEVAKQYIKEKINGIR